MNNIYKETKLLAIKFESTKEILILMLEKKIKEEHKEIFN